MPAVKPMRTDSGMNRMTPPIFASPKASSIPPAMRVTICRPGMP